MKSLFLLFFSLFSVAQPPPPAPDPGTVLESKEKPEVIGAIKNWQNPNDELKVTLPVTKYKLKNGLTVLLLEDHTVPMVSYHTWYKVGSRNEAPGITGSAHMLEHMMFKGAKKYSGKQFDQIMNENGVSHNAFTTFDYTGFYQSVPSSKLETIMDLEVDRMSSLALKESDLLSEREVVKEERRWRVDNNPKGLLFETTMANVFHVHPYKWPVIGTMEDISNYNVQTLRKYYNTYYVPNNAVLVIAGDFKTDEVKKLIDKYYSKLPYKEVPVPKISPEPPQTVQYNAFIKQDVQNVSFNVAFQGLPQGDDQMYALDLASYILGAGTSSRLYKRLVYDAQIATSAEAYHYSLKDHGLFNVVVSLKPGLTQEKALDIVYNEIYKLRTKDVAPQELKKAKTLAMKSFVDSLTSIDGKARALAASEIVTGSYENIFHDLEKYNKVTAEDIRKASEKLLNQNQRSIVVLQPKEKIP
jgi:zinc protease